MAGLRRGRGGDSGGGGGRLSPTAGGCAGYRAGPVATALQRAGGGGCACPRGCGCSCARVGIRADAGAPRFYYVCAGAGLEAPRAAEGCGALRCVCACGSVPRWGGACAGGGIRADGPPPPPRLPLRAGHVWRRPGFGWAALWLPRHAGHIRCRRGPRSGGAVANAAARTTSLGRAWRPGELRPRPRRRLWEAAASWAAAPPAAAPAPAAAAALRRRRRLRLLSRLRRRPPRMVTGTHRFVERK